MDTTSILLPPPPVVPLHHPLQLTHLNRIHTQTRKPTIDTFTMCHEAPIWCGCCGKEWVPEPDQNFTRPLLAVCDQAQLGFEYVDDDEEETLVQPRPCVNLVRGIPAGDWDGILALTYPSYSCSDCAEDGRRPWQWPLTVHSRDTTDARRRWRRADVVEDKQRLEQNTLERVFDGHDRGMRGIWTFLDVMLAVKTSHEDMWHCAQQGFWKDTRQGREVADRHAFSCFRNYCAAIDSFVKYSEYCRRDYGTWCAPRPDDAPGDENIDH